jgi:transposase
LEIPWRQVCWAHLKRDFQKLVDRAGTAAATGTAALAIEREVFALWHRFKQGEFDRAALQQQIKPLRGRLWQVLDAGVQGDDFQTAGFCAQLCKLWPAEPALSEANGWTFVQYEGMEPTNNVAERALRPAVLWRKGSGRVGPAHFGCHSAEGSRFAERMLILRPDSGPPRPVGSRDATCWSLWSRPTRPRG